MYFLTLTRVIKGERGHFWDSENNGISWKMLIFLSSWNHLFKNELLIGQWLEPILTLKYHLFVLTSICMVWSPQSPTISNILYRFLLHNDRCNRTIEITAITYLCRMCVPFSTSDNRAAFSFNKSFHYKNRTQSYSLSRKCNVTNPIIRHHGTSQKALVAVASSCKAWLLVADSSGCWIRRRWWSRKGLGEVLRISVSWGADFVWLAQVVGSLFGARITQLLNRIIICFSRPDVVSSVHAAPTPIYSCYGLIHFYTYLLTVESVTSQHVFFNVTNNFRFIRIIICFRL